MFESISWQEYLSATTLLIGGYYVITTLLLFSGEITTIFKQGKLDFSIHRPNSPQVDSNESSNLMGKVRYESQEQQNTQREEKIDVEQLRFIANKDEEEAIEVFDTIEENRKGDIQSIKEEVETLAQVVSRNDKEECVSLFQSLLSRYPQLYGSSCQEEINLIIYNSLKSDSFQIDIQEIDSWWPEP